MAKHKVTLITTVRNEEEDILLFLKSLTRQIKQPDEIIITDAGSTDKTLEKLKQFQKTNKTPLKIIIKEGNRSQGRNEAIKHARGEIIACSDVGCILEKNWLKSITAPFQNTKIDVVSGFYHPQTNNDFEQCVATYTCVMPDKVNPAHFLPSSRSIAFKKSAWEKVGGYPSNLDTCEDLVFANNLKKSGYTFFFAPDALVYWKQRKNIIQAFKQFFSYALGDGQARFIRKTIPFLYLRYLIGISLLIIAISKKSLLLYLILLLLGVLYILWAIKKNYKYVKNPQAFFYLPLLQFTADIAVLLGTTIGVTRHIDIEKHN
jgi:glycosyltransferase involved in cell wall biosynthesis